MIRLALAALILGLVLGSASAQRLHNSIDIHACYKIKNGKLRLADVNADGLTFCRRNELPIEWPASCECPP